MTDATKRTTPATDRKYVVKLKLTLEEVQDVTAWAAEKSINVTDALRQMLMDAVAS